LPPRAPFDLADLGVQNPAAFADGTDIGGVGRHRGELAQVIDHVAARE
jgi:hypothetical protein